MPYGFVNGQNYVYNSDTLSWEPQAPSTAISVSNLEIYLDGVEGKLDALLSELQQKTEPISIQSTEQERIDLLYASGSASSSGNNTLITPASGKKIRVFYLSYNPGGAVEVGFRFGAAGTLILRNNIVTGGSIISKDFGEFRNITGAANEALVLNLSSAVSTIWNCFYQEVD